MNRRLLSWGPVAAYSAVLALLSLRPVPEELPFAFGIDKLYHLMAYMVLGALLVRAFDPVRKGRVKKVILISSVIAFTFGAVMEAFQMLLTDFRTADPGDALANGLGGVIGSIAWGMLMKPEEGEI